MQYRNGVLAAFWWRADHLRSAWAAEAPRLADAAAKQDKAALRALIATKPT